MSRLQPPSCPRHAHTCCTHWDTHHQCSQPHSESSPLAAASTRTLSHPRAHGLGHTAAGSWWQVDCERCARTTTTTDSPYHQLATTTSWPPSHGGWQISASHPTVTSVRGPLSAVRTHVRCPNPRPPRAIGRIGHPPSRYWDTNDVLVHQAGGKCLHRSGLNDTDCNPKLGLYCSTGRVKCCNSFDCVSVPPPHATGCTFSRW